MPVHSHAKRRPLVTGAYRFRLRAASTTHSAPSAEPPVQPGRLGWKGVRDIQDVRC